MTGNVTHLLYGHQQGVAVAVVANGFYLLEMPRSSPLVPQFLARPAPEPGISRCEGFFQGFLIHPGHHQHGAIQIILHNGGNQTLLVVANLVKKEQCPERLTMAWQT